jgi:hypothetical protein
MLGYHLFQTEGSNSSCEEPMVAVQVPQSEL